jgi:periplasmic copper chaperone A
MRFFAQLLAVTLLLTACTAQPKALGTGRSYYDAARDPNSELTISEVWMRATGAAGGEHSAHGGGKVDGPKANGAVYFKISNSGAADTLLGAAGSNAQAFELHETKDVNGMLRMDPAPAGFDIPARGEVVLKPAGKHLMLQGMDRTYIEGEFFVITLTFKSGRMIRPEVLVQSP